MDVTLLVLNIGNVALHGFGVYILTCLYNQGQRNSQNLFLINLSISEILIGLFDCFNRIPDLISVSDDILTIINTINNYITIVAFTGIAVVYYMVMIYITLDRLLNILLSLRYRIYCTETKAKNLLQVTWIVALLICTSISLTHHFNGYIWQTTFFMYVYPTFDFGFITLALITYVFIFFKYRKSRRIYSQSSRQPNIKRESTFKIFRKSNFFVAVLLILTFVIFMLIPKIVYLFYGIVGNNESDTLSAICDVSYGISNLADGWIYFFMQKSVKAMAWTKMHNLKNYFPKRTLFSQRRSQDISRVDGISMDRVPDGIITNIHQIAKPSKPDLPDETLSKDVTEINTSIM